MMDQTITFGDVANSIGALAGLLIAGFGGLAFFAAGMASSPTPDSRRTGNRGCAAFIIGVIIFGWCLWDLIK